MGLGPTLVGGVIGAAVGMGLHLIVELTTDYEAPWFAVIIGLLTGLGVHQANKSLAGRVSYRRGAVAAAIALVAIVGSTPLISFVNKHLVGEASELAGGAPAGDVAGREAAPDNENAKGGAEGENEERRAEPASDDVAARSRSVGAAVAAQARRPAELEYWQAIFMAIGTFIAYEFGRGTNKGQGVLVDEPPREPVGTDPSN